MTLKTDTINDILIISKTINEDIMVNIIKSSAPIQLPGGRYFKPTHYDTGGHYYLHYQTQCTDRTTSRRTLLLPYTFRYIFMMPYNISYGSIKLHNYFFRPLT